MKINSIRFKTSVLYSGVLSLILIGFSVYLFGTVRHVLYQEVKRDLKLKASEIDAFLDAYGSMSPQKNSSAYFMNQFLSASDEEASTKWIISHLWQQDSKSLGLRSDFFRILSIRGHVRLRSNNLTDVIERQFSAHFPFYMSGVHFIHLQLKNVPYYGISYPFAFLNRKAFILQLITPVASVYRVLSRLVICMIIGAVVILLMTVFMGSFLTRRILKPVIDTTVAANDITQTNLHLRIPEQKLDHEMEELIGSFNRMIGRLEQSFIHVNEFSSHVAHELKTPLAIIKSELELALVKSQGENDKRAMKAALGEIDRLIRIVKDMLLLAKLEYKLNIFKMEQMDLSLFLEDVYRHTRILADEKGINFQWTPPSHPILLQGDLVHLRRVFFNILHNAVKFTPSGGRIEIICQVSPKQVIISVKDSGIGIAPADQPHIFEKFYRIRRIEHDDHSGSGLGLCMARTIARSHGGDISFESELNKGSIFRVILPLAKQSSLYKNLINS